jgi:hypothetical protein
MGFSARPSPVADIIRGPLDNAQPVAGALVCDGRVRLVLKITARCMCSSGHSPGPILYLPSGHMREIQQVTKQRRRAARQHDRRDLQVLVLFREVLRGC